MEVVSIKTFILVAVECIGKGLGIEVVVYKLEVGVIMIREKKTRAPGER